MGPTQIVVCLSAVWCANAARLRRSFAKKVEEEYPGTPIQPVEQYARFPYPIKISRGSSQEVDIIEPDMISNAIRTEPKDGVKAGPSVRAGDGWVTFRQGEGAYNSTGAYDLKCCVICTPEPDCQKMKCLSACKKLCGPACVVPAKASDKSITHHMVKGYENLHSVAVAKQVLVPNAAWARAALGPVPISGPAPSGQPVIPAEPAEKPKEKEPEKEEKPKEKKVEEKPKEKEPEEKPKEKEPEEEKPKEKVAEKEEKPEDKGEKQKEKKDLNPEKLA